MNFSIDDFRAFLALMESHMGYDFQAVNMMRYLELILLVMELGAGSYGCAQPLGYYYRPGFCC